MTTFSRADWQAPAPAGGNRLTGPLHRVFVHHTVGRTPATVDEALAEVLAIWHQHTGSNGWSDIGYSWLVDDAGNCFEGRGWLRSGAHTEGHNSTAHAICWMGNSMTRRPSTSAVAAIAQCILDGQRVGAVGPSPSIEGHRDVNATACPGDTLYDALPTIRLAVLGGDLNGVTTPPTPEDDVLTPEQATQLREVHFWLGQGYVAGGTVAAMRPDIDALAGKIDAIAGTAVDLTKAPTAALVAELGRRAQ